MLKSIAILPVTDSIHACHTYMYNQIRIYNLTYKLDAGSSFGRTQYLHYLCKPLSDYLARKKLILICIITAFTFSVSYMAVGIMAVIFESQSLINFA